MSDDIKEHIRCAMFSGMTMSLRDDLCEMLDELWFEAAEKDREIERQAQTIKDMTERQAEWRDMGTAPKSGAEFIGYRPDQGVFVCRWASMLEVAPDDYDPIDEDYECWWHDVWGWMEGELTPTHWMPLPAPPEATP